MLGVSKGAKKLATQLVVVGLFDEVEGGYRVHDYHDYNDTREEAQQRRANLSSVRSHAGRLGGIKSGVIRQANTEANTKQIVKQVAEAKRSPIPSHPIPSQEKTKEQSSAEPKNAPPVIEFLNWFQEEYKKRRNGATYCVVWAKHGAIVKRLLQTYPPERLRRHAVILLTATVDEWIEDTDRGIEVLAGKINWLEDRLTAWEKKHQAREAV